MAELFSRYTDNTVAECFDEAVIARNNWIMYGSSKQDSPPYQVTPFARLGLMVAPVTEPLTAEPCDYIELFSIRNKLQKTPRASTVPS